MPRIFAVLLFLFLTGWQAPSAWAEEPPQATPYLRTILVFYNSESGQTPLENTFREGFAFVANYLGMTLQYRDVAKRPLPSDEEMAGVRGIVTSFVAGGMGAPEAYLRWLLRQMDHGRPVLLLGGLGALEDKDGRPVDLELPKEIFRKLGLEFQPDFLANQSLLHYTFANKTLTGFERPLPVFPPVYEHFAPLPEADPWILVGRRDKPNAQSALVATSPAGGLAMWEYVYWEDPISYAHQWYIDPFSLLRKSLQWEGVPALTPTTVSGLRVAVSHVDADGFGGYSEVNKTAYCGQVVIQQIFSRYNFPITASLIQAEVDPELSGSPDLLKAARDLMRMDNIEPASHTYSHPFYWDPEDENKVKLYQDKLGVDQYGVHVEGYRFNATMEIVESTSWISKVVDPPDKPCSVLLWSGDCEPTAEQVRLCQEHGLLNMNGGDTVYDAAHNSLFGVSPLYQPFGDAIQVLTGQANDNILTNDWTGPFFAYRNIIETMRRTGAPRRLAPIDIYYHFFSGEKFASLQALRDVYQWTMAQPVAPMFTSAYIRMVLDFVKARISRRPDGAWIIENYGECASLRIPAGFLPDLPRCQDVQGYFASPEGIFVHLEPGGRAVVFLSHTDGSAPHLQWATGVVRRFSVHEREIRLHFDCFGEGRLRLAGLDSGAVWEASGPGLSSKEYTVDKDGGLTIEPLGSGDLSLRAR
ncbi:MAG: polysaccharide biosynthesis protein PelA [Desulfovibrionales bacterium]|nr:polysaccharide biosynthesis protein PelA [Desulfovibrionales bacterium]